MTNRNEKQGEPKNTIADGHLYAEFYEHLGQTYPESQIVHKDRSSPASRYQTVLRELARFAVDGKRLLDLGCNDGVYSIPYSKSGGSVVGVDISSSLVARASKSALDNGVGERCNFVTSEIDSSFLVKKLGAQKFDVVLLSEVLEHILDQRQALINIHDLLSDRSTLILTTPTPLFENLASFSPRYVGRVLRGKRLLEEHAIETTKVHVLAEHGISPFLYRHDGYYPLALRKYIQSFGFGCEKMYTISFPHWVRNRLLYPLRELGKDVDMTARRIPVVKMFGGTIVSRFIRVG
jgi:2-polyprenyl-3-methyl-5-hydroxy-6-metoxy-1,4-benzoquinol methylase